MNIPTNLNDKLVEEIDKLAKAENRSRNNMIETLLIDAIAYRTALKENYNKTKKGKK